MARDLTVIVVSHESADDLGPCLTSLFEHAGSIDVLVVVSDAGSIDRTADVAKRFPVVYLPGPNQGFARGNNRALAHPLAKGSRYVLFLNPDTEILDGTLEELVAACDARPETGLFTVRQVDQHGDLNPNLWRFPGLRRYAAEAFPIGPLASLGVALRDRAVYAREVPFECATGSFLLVRRDVLDTIGGFDERFFLFHEEFDLCRRARLAGFSGAYLPLMIFMHRTTGRTYDRRRAVLKIRAKLVYESKWGRRTLPAARLAFAVRYLRYALDPRSADLRREGRTKLRETLTFRP
jgi:N-acetylglucosaminyl-diphospho-decaprenol L-rhamnosyltransferase